MAASSPHPGHVQSVTPGNDDGRNMRPSSLSVSATSIDLRPDHPAGAVRLRLAGAETDDHTETVERADRTLQRMNTLIERLDEHREHADRASHQLQERLRVSADLLRAMHGQMQRVESVTDAIDQLEQRANAAVTRLVDAQQRLEAVERRVAQRLGELDHIHERLARAADRADAIEQVVETAEVSTAATLARLRAASDPQA